MKQKIKDTLAVVLLIAALCFVFWAETCAVIFIFCAILGLTFNLAISTGIWVVLLSIIIASIVIKAKRRMR